MSAKETNWSIDFFSGLFSRAEKFKQELGL